ncbi:MAG: GIY-YIG nuclease family protein [Acidobacteriota bacterium]|nr:GIY-YIG nuclease family protein [Acidobacteriota bacterium]
MPEYKFFVYMLASISGTVYIGMTNDIYSRVLAHKAGEGSWFTSHYGVDRLVYVERFRYVNRAIARETQLKRWRREKKVKLIELANPKWKDLAAQWGKPLSKLVVP